MVELESKAPSTQPTCAVASALVVGQWLVLIRNGALWIQAPNGEGCAVEPVVLEQALQKLFTQHF